MYFVKYGKEYLHDPRTDNTRLLDLSFDTEENSYGYCDFTIYPDHPMYNKIRERDADNPIKVYDGDSLLFTGFIYELGKEFYLSGQVKCMGELSYLNESIVRPYSTVETGYATKVPDNVYGYFEWLINQHNSQVHPNKQFKIGINQGKNLNTSVYIYRESTKYPKTFDEIKEKILDMLGGFLRVRYEGDDRYIDLLSEWTESNTQILDFGKNLTDYTQTDDSSDICTFVVPLGARMRDTEYTYDNGYYKTKDTKPNKEKIYYTLSNDGDYSQCNEGLTAFESGVTYYEYFADWDESDLPLTIKGITAKLADDYIISNDIIYCESAVKKYGWIGMSYENTELKTKEDLATYGLVALREYISPKRTIEIKAIDMHLLNPNIKPISVGEYIRVRSKPHNLDSYFLCRSVSLNLNNPENSTYTLGTSFDTLTGQQNTRIKTLNQSINSVYEAAEKISDEAKASAIVAKDAIEEARKKSRVYITTPTTPYDEGDMWVRENTSILSHADEPITLGSTWTCIKTKSDNESFSEDDWVLVSTDDSLAQDAIGIADDALASAVTANDVASSTKDKVDNMQIGGRNLIKSSDLQGLKEDTTRTTEEFIASTWGAIFLNHDSIINAIVPGETYTISYKEEIIERTEVPTVHDMSSGFLLYSPSTSSANRILYSDLTEPYLEVGAKTATSITFIAPNPIPDDYVMLIYTRLWTTNGTKPDGYDTIKFTNIKLELGNMATDWTPSPMDTKSDMNEQIKNTEEHLTSDFNDLMISYTEGNYLSKTDFDSFYNKTYNTYVEKTDKALSVKASGEQVNNLSERVNEIETYVKIDVNGVTVGDPKSEYASRVTPNAFEIGTRSGETEFTRKSWLDGDTLYNKNVDVSETLSVGKSKEDTNGHYEFRQESDGTMSIVYKV